MGKFDHAEYYRKNREQILAKRKRRYRSDNAYREAILARRRTARRRQREEKRAAGLDDRRVIRTDRTTYVSIGRLAGMINRQVQTIRNYHREGVLPEPLAHDSRGWRLYTVSQATMMAQLFRQYDSDTIDRQQLIDQIRAGWEE